MADDKNKMAEFFKSEDMSYSRIGFGWDIDKSIHYFVCSCQ